MVAKDILLFGCGEDNDDDEYDDDDDDNNNNNEDSIVISSEDYHQTSRDYHQPQRRLQHGGQSFFCFLDVVTMMKINMMTTPTMIYI